MFYAKVLTASMDITVNITDTIQNQAHAKYLTDLYSVTVTVTGRLAGQQPVHIAEMK